MDHINISKSELLEEIEALQRKAQESQMTILKIEGALQFAHHLLRQVESDQHHVVSEDTPTPTDHE